VLQGQIERGDVERMRAAIWFSDIRDFTARSQALGVAGTVALLNEYFEIIGEAVEAEGGEILKFIGDASLVVFPCVRSDREACDRALAAAQRAQAAASAVLGAHKPGDFASGIGLHLGEVAYGNIGARDRLDFTIIGTTVNLTARLEDLCSVTGEPLLASAAFADAVSSDFEHLDDFDLKGLSGPTPVYRLQRHQPPHR
jgi:adenylate cyclase